jgi:hypothetical protein
MLHNWQIPGAAQGGFESGAGMPMMAPTTDLERA